MSSFRSGLTVGRKIGQGHFGEVFLGQDPVHGPVAIKSMVKGSSETDLEWSVRKAGLLQEAQHLRQATHRNVVQVHHLLEDEANNTILFVMKLCPGGSLQASFDAGPVGLPRMLRIATDVTHGLQALHARGMLHRDLKPGNLLVGDNNVTMLGDFGLVTDNLILGYASQAGYWDHLAPEVHAMGGTSAKTDVWALGMTLYRLLHGKVWYEEMPRPANSVPDGGFARALRWLPHVPESWRRFIRKMLHDDPTRRLPHATAVFEALSSLPCLPDWQCDVSHTDVAWRRDTPSRRISVLWRRHDARRHEWRAWSEPLPGMTGRPKTLGTSNGNVSRLIADRKLCDFFASQC